MGRSPPDYGKIEKKFIPNFVSIACPLHQLLKKNHQFEWKQEQEDVFNRLKNQLTDAPVLRYSDFDKSFIIYANASRTSLGAVLAQKDDLGKEYMCLAIVWAIEYFCHYFGLDLFFVITDHAALKWLQTSALTGRRAR
ncbi:5404_t:CDS:2 [Dentiscutata erythropus]|uniref:5404_t:CDS:1 n=1 Tax=Dentiscutata erythropus TaxID=1348616 RepID=A0A9N8VUU2_9GLOM|nr:5404_t:CDS:2 [Dentiscutata erythropus]